MFQKIFGVAYLALTGLALLGVASVGSVFLGLFALAWAIAWLANA